MTLYYPAAIQDPAPAWKVWPEANAMAGVICHSMVGGWSSARSRLMGADQASWHFSVLKDGRVIQAYPLDASTWHAGGKPNNIRMIGIEHEGGGVGNFSESLTTAQRDASVALVRWIGQQCGWQPSRDAPRTLHEHGELHATQCPSGRIPWGEYTAMPLEIHLIKVGGSGVAGGPTIVDPSNGVTTRVYDFGGLGQFEVVVKEK